MIEHEPPRMAAKLSGISSIDCGILHLTLQLSTTGIIMATIGVLLRKAEKNATGNKRRSCAERIVVGLRRMYLITRLRALLSSTIRRV